MAATIIDRVLAEPALEACRGHGRTNPWDGVDFLPEFVAWFRAAAPWRDVVVRLVVDDGEVSLIVQEGPGRVTAYMVRFSAGTPPAMIAGATFEALSGGRS